jgi:hypothetical protein
VSARGSDTVKRLPRPTTLSTVIVPPWARRRKAMRPHIPSRRLLLAIVALAAAGLLAAVDRGRANEPDSALQVYAQTGSRTYKPGQEVELILKVVNPGPSEVTLRFPSSQQADFVIADHGRPIWRWSDGRVFAQVVTELRLAAGATKVYTARWRQLDRAGQPVAPNIYELTARLTTIPPLEAHTRIEIH